MTDEDTFETDEQRKALAGAFDRPADPLADAGDVFDELDIDPFELFQTEVLKSRNLADSTYRIFDSVFEQWRRFMRDRGRHPACPTPDHVEAYIEWQTAPEAGGGEDNANRTVKEKLRKLNQAYRYWQQDAAFPHPDGYNPFYIARDRVPLPVQKEKEYRRIPISELGDMVSSVTDLRARALIATQMKLGLRAGEVANVRLADLQLDDAEAPDHYPTLGTSERVEGYENVLYVPSKHTREGNKSSRPRLLPLDRELRSLLDRYLLVRPDNGEPWLFLSQKSHTQLNSSVVNEIWKEWFHPEYAETDEYRPVTSHFGRHLFTTYWRVEQNLNRQLVKYLRGDRTGAFRNDRGINAYLHAYFEDIEPVYRAQIFSLLDSG